MRAPLIIIVMLACGAEAAAQQRCNPVIDGTYCAEQMPKRGRSGTASQPLPKMQPIQPLRDPSSAYHDTPGTLGGIQFGSTGENCVGFMRRGKCQ